MYPYQLFSYSIFSSTRMGGAIICIHIGSFHIWSSLVRGWGGASWRTGRGSLLHPRCWMQVLIPQMTIQMMIFPRCWMQVPDNEDDASWHWQCGDNSVDNSLNEDKGDDDCGDAKRIVFVLSSPSILEMFSRLCGLTNCITWGLSQVKPFLSVERKSQPSTSGSRRSSGSSVGPCDCVRQRPPHLLPHVGLRSEDQQVPKHRRHLQEGQALHKLPCDAEEVWQEDL